MGRRGVPSEGASGGPGWRQSCVWPEHNFSLGESPSAMSNDCDMPESDVQSEDVGGSNASESEHEVGAVYAGRRYSKPRSDVTWEEVGKFSRVAMTAADIDKAVHEIAQAQIVPFLGPEWKEFKVLQSDLSRWKLKQAYVSHDGTAVCVYNCPAKFRFGCKSSLRAKTQDDYVTVEVCNPHDADSHAVDKSLRLSMAEKKKIIQAWSAGCSIRPSWTSPPTTCRRRPPPPWLEAPPR